MSAKLHRQFFSYHVCMVAYSYLRAVVMIVVLPIETPDGE